jgi:hypothetical protein
MVASQRERVVMFAGLPGHPDIAIAFSTMAGTRPGQSMLARNAAAAANEPLYVRAAFKTLREKNRTINGLAGEELALRVREPNFATTFSFDWEMVGKQDDVLAPLLTLEMESGVRPRPGAKPVQSSLSEESLVALWDRISSTIRVRPTTPPKLAKAAPPLRPLGTLASAGDLCPQDGWWQCNDGGSGLRVLGGQRQYLKKGQRIPQALLLPSQTVWEKVRGLQRSVEASTPTLWKLVDNRATPRGAPKVPLAQATLVPRADARDVTTPTIIAGDSNLPVGSYVRTGEPCPASGWWRCEQSHALDGTRWFAHGSLLPAATFKVPPGVFGRSSGGPEVIQRRSSWQLVRYAHAEHEGRAGNAGAGDDPGGGTASGPESAV